MVNAQDEENPFEIDGIVVKPTTANGRRRPRRRARRRARRRSQRRNCSRVSQHNTAYCCPPPGVRPQRGPYSLNS